MERRYDLNHAGSGSAKPNLYSTHQCAHLSGEEERKERKEKKERSKLASLRASLIDNLGMQMVARISNTAHLFYLILYYRVHPRVMSS